MNLLYLGDVERGDARAAPGLAKLFLYFVK